MRYYVIINGINSLTIPGLAIKDLPPISKTLMRNQKEEIDGRDGDIITELGYSAYDKTMTIGLYGSYDINQIIAFFNQKGTIVFSDEPDKYYNFTILDQIDYDKLVKFRTATIRIHCQPFKYPVSETPVEIEAEYVTATGEDITLNNTGIAPLEISLKGNTYQETTTGKNLIRFPYDATSGTYGNVAVTMNNDGSVTFSGTGNETAYINFIASANKIHLGAGTYTLSTKNAGIEFTIRDTAGNLGYIARTQTSATFTLSEAKDVYLYFAVRNGVSYNVTIYPMLETGSSATEWEKPTNGASPNPSYPQEVQVVTGDNTITISNSDNTQSQEYEINLGTLELCKIGDYQDYLYKSGENWYKHTEIGKITLNGSESIATTNFSNLYWIGKSALNIDYLTGGFSDNFKYIEDSRIVANNEANDYLTNNQMAFRLGTNKDRLYIKSTNFATATDLQTWLTTHNTLVYYVLATPTEEQITNAELIEQLEAILNAVSYEDQTNISQENDNLAFILDVSALQKGTNEAIIDNEGNIYSKPIINIVGDGIVGVSLNGSQILSLDMTTYNDITIDTETMEAYDPNTSQLRNRQVTGNYSNLRLQPGENTISLNGRITSATISKYKRWL